MAPKPAPNARVQLVRIAATVLLALTAVGCADNEASSDDEVVLGASDVGATQAATGTDLLTQAVEGCDTVDGDYLWKNATEDDVHSFTHEVEGGARITVIGTWPMSKDAWIDAEKNMTYNGGDCVPDGVSVQGQTLGGVSEAYPGWGLAASAITYRQKGSEPMEQAVRAYGYTKGHMVIVWVKQPDTRPDTDRIVDLLNKQAEKVDDSSRR